MEQMCNKQQRGFTFIDTLLSITLLGIAIGVGTALLQTFQARADIDSAQTMVLQMMRTAQHRARTQSHDSSWGVHMDGNVLTLFQGGNWTSRTVSFDEQSTLSDAISLSGVSDVVFQKTTGLPNTFGTTTLMGGGHERYVHVNAIGSVSSGTILPPELLPGDIHVRFGATSILSGGTLSDGTQIEDIGRLMQFTIENPESGMLRLTGDPLVSFGNPVNITSTSLTAPPLVNIPPTGSTQFSLTYTPQSPGPYSFRVSVANDDPNENPYTWTISGTAVAPPSEMAVVSNVAVADGGVHAVGQQQRNVNRTITYRIDNTGPGALSLTGVPLVAVAAGTRVSLVSVTTPPPATIPPGGSGTLVITYRVTNTGAFNFTVSIPNTDSNENPYNWTVSGNAAGSGGGNIGP